MTEAPKSSPLPRLDNPRWGTDYDRPGGDVLRYHRAGADDAAVADAHSGGNHHLAGDPHVVLDGDRAGFNPLFVDRNVGISEDVVGGEHHHMRRDAHPVADGNRPAFDHADQDRIGLHCAVVADRHLALYARAGGDRAARADAQQATARIYPRLGMDEAGGVQTHPGMALRQIVPPAEPQPLPQVLGSCHAVAAVDKN
jgi:hypothetical protein